MRWRGAARIGVATAGIGCAVAIAVYTWNRPKPQEEPARSLAAIDPKTTVQSGAGQTIRFKAEGQPTTLTYGSMGLYADGRQWFRDVKVDGMEGSRFSIHADLLDTQGKAQAGDVPARMDVTGHVVITSNDGVELKTDKAAYDDAAGQLTIPGPVSFTKGRLSGHAVGGIYDRLQDTVTLLDEAVARVEPDANGKGAADATSLRMTMAQGQHMLRLEGRAKIVGDTQTLTSREATFTFTDDESAVKYLELRGAARVTPNAGKKADQPAMGADNITMTFYPDGLTLQHATLTGSAKLIMAGTTARSIRASWIDMFAAPDGRLLTRLDARDRVVVDLAATGATPGRTITSNVLSATGDDKKGLTAAQFEGTPVFTELPPAGPRAGRAGTPASAGSRTGTATVLALKLGGQIDAIETAEFQQKARFVDGEVTGEGDVAIYGEAKGQLRLKPNPREPRRPSSVTNADMRVDAWEIDVATGKQDLDARGNVTTQMTRASGGAGKSDTALFGGKEPINGVADKFTYEKSAGRGTYTSVTGAQPKLWQGSSKVSADRIVFEDGTHNLQATGHVDSTFPFDDAPVDGTKAGHQPAAPQKTYGVHAETLRYDEAKRTVTYSSAGSLVTLKTDDGDVESRTLTFVLAATAGALEEMRAEQDVYAKLSGNYEAVAEVLVYTAKTEEYVLYGKPGEAGKTAIVRSPNDQAQPPATGAAPAGCTLTEGLQIVVNRRNRTVQQPGQSQAPRTSNSGVVSCTSPLRRHK